MAKRKKNIINKVLHPLYARGPLELGEESRRQLFTLFLFLIILPLLIFGVIQLKKGHPEYGITNLILALVLFGIIFSLRYVKNTTWNFRGTTLLLMLLVAYWMITGAVNGAASIWIIAFPPFLFFLFGRKEGFIWTAILLIMALLFFYNLLELSWIYEFSVPLATRIMATFIMVLFFTANYENLRIAFLNQLKEEQNKLIEEKNQLQKEMNIRQTAEKELLDHRNRLEELVNARTMELQQKNADLQDALYITRALNDDLASSEKMLSESEKRYRILADNATDLIWSMDMKLQFTYISPAMEKIYGYSVEEAMDLTLEKMNTEKSLQVVLDAWVENMKLEDDPGADPNRSMVLEIEQVKKDGSLFWSEIRVSYLREETGEPTGIIGVTRDVTERKKTQDLLMQTEKMMTVGGLAAGMAHELNNPLSIIMNSAQNLERRISPELQENLLQAQESGTELTAITQYMEKRKITDYVQYIHDASKRASDIIHDMLMFSRKSTMVYEEKNVNEIIDMAVELYSKDYDLSEKYDFKNITIERDYSSDLPFLTCVVTQIEQVILNILKNAAIALTSSADDRDAPLIRVKTCREGEDVVIKVIDNGHGMDEETLEHIFEPFYTTKEPGKGTGLGLSVSYYIITTNHGGSISASSWPDRGTTVVIRLPAR